MPPGKLSDDLKIIISSPQHFISLTFHPYFQALWHRSKRVVNLYLQFCPHLSCIPLRPSCLCALCHIPTDAKSELIGKDPDAGKVWGQEEKGATENEIVGWHHQFNGRELSKLWETVEDREALHAAVHGVAELDMTWRLNSNIPTDCSLVTVMLNLDFFSYLLVGPAAGNISPPESLSPPETSYFRMTSSLRSTVLNGSGTSAYVLDVSPMNPTSWLVLFPFSLHPDPCTWVQPFPDPTSHGLRWSLLCSAILILPLGQAQLNTHIRWEVFPVEL